MSDRNELMYNFLLVLRELIANRFCFICDWEGSELGDGRRQQTLPVGSGGAGNVPTVSCSWAKNGESWILRRVSAGICASGKRKQELMSLIVESGTFNYLNAPNRLRVDERIRWLSYKNSSVRNENRLYKHRTSVYCWLVWSKPRAPCLTMLYYSDKGEIGKSINISKIHIFSRLV